MSFVQAYSYLAMLLQILMHFSHDSLSWFEPDYLALQTMFVQRRRHFSGHTD